MGRSHLTACEKILRDTNGMGYEQFAEQEVIQDAILRNIEIISEAAKKLSDEVKGRFPSIEWKNIAGMRDWLSHAYFRVDTGIVWDVIENKVPELVQTLQALKDEDQP